jgi:uncharacterized membrane protein (DUF4010 family)
MGAVTLVLAAFFAARARSEQQAGPSEVLLRNPFSLISAARFALFFAMVLVAVRITQLHFPGGGYYVVAGLAGLADVDAIALSMAGLVREGGIDPGTGVGAIVVAALMNTVAKCGLVVVFASPGLRRRALASAALLLATGLAVAFL